VDALAPELRPIADNHGAPQLIPAIRQPSDGRLAVPGAADDPLFPWAPIPDSPHGLDNGAAHAITLRPSFSCLATNLSTVSQFVHRNQFFSSRCAVHSSTWGALRMRSTVNQ
jgi:hypothetical protein